MFNVQATTKDAQSSKDLLETKYYCKIEDPTLKEIEVVMELEAKGKPEVGIFNRFVLLIDVSGSMDHTADGQSCTLLDRMKKFIELFIDNASDTSWIGIVTFSSTANVIMELKQMTAEAKVFAKTTVQSLTTESRTNISAGLFMALEVIQKLKPSRDCIIVFTDGVANEGIVDSGTLIQEYKRISLQSRETNIPISAITVEGYKPDFLYAIATELGSDAFYCLNINSAFEADMMIPQITKEMTFTTDVTIVASALGGVKMLRMKNQQSLNETEAKHFYYSLPNKMKKNILFRLQLPDNYREMVNAIILNVEVKFMDGKLSRRCFTDSVQLCLKTMQEVAVRQKLPASADTEASRKYRESAVAYVSYKSVIDATWKSIRKSITKICEEQCKMEIARYFSAAREQCNGQDSNKAEAAREKDAAQKFMQEKLKLGELALGLEDKTFTSCSQQIHIFEKQLVYAQRFIENTDASELASKIWGKLAAMGSSFEKEMPTNDGVFESTVKQPFMNNTVKKPLKELRKAIQETTVDTESSDEESVASDVEDTPEPEPENIPLSDRGRESNRVTFENVALASGGAIASGLVSNIVGWYVFIVIAIIAFVVWAVEVQGTDRVIVMLFFALCGAAYILPSQVFCFLLGVLFGIFWPNLPDWWRS